MTDNNVPIVKKNWIKKPTVRNILLLVIIGLVYYFAKPTTYSFIVGGFFVIIGELIRLWAAGFLMKNQELIIVGPYAYIRDPLYLGSCLIFSGICITAQSWPLLVVVLLGFFAFYLPRKIRIETARLEEIFGEPYVNYKNNVKSIIPRLTPYVKSEEKWEFNQIFRNSEHATGLVVIIAWLLYLIYLK